MAHVTADRIYETTTTAGTGAITLGGAISGYYTFSSAMATGDTCYYVIFDSTTGDNEEGIGTYTSAGNTLARTTVLRSSNANSLVVFGSAAKTVFITAPAARLLQQNVSGQVVGVPTSTAGGVVFSDTTGTWRGTAAGTAGQYLQSAGSGTPAWTTIGASGVGAPAYYGAFHDTTAAQTAASTTTAYLVACGTTDIANGVSISAGRITVTNAGIYNFQFSIQLSNPNAGISDVSVWLRQNGVDVADSTGTVAVVGKHGSVNGLMIVGWNYVISMAAGDYIELWWQSDLAGTQIVTLPATTGPTVPETPGVIYTLTSLPQIGIGYYNMTSTTSTLIGTGSKTLTVSTTATSSAFNVGTRVRVAYTTTPANFMEGVVTAFSGTSMTVSVDTTGGSGTFALWTISVAGQNGLSALTIGTSTVSGGTSGYVIYNNAGVVGNLPVTGTAGNVVLSTNPTITNPIIGITSFADYWQPAGGSATQATVTFQALGTDTNINVALTPKGTGAVIAGPLPDGTSTGGNARGGNAVDLQTSRTGNTQIASGQYSTLIGGGANSATNTYCIVAGSVGSTASGFGAGVFAGHNNVASGTYTAVVGGESGNDYGRQFWLGTGAGAAGWQYGWASVRATTTATTAKTLTSLDTTASSGNIINLQNNSSMKFRIDMIGRDASGASGVAAWTLSGVMVRGATASTTAIVGTVVTNVDVLNGTLASQTSPTVTADTTNGGFNISITPVTANAVHWIAKVAVLEVQ